ncbi:MAG: hypothetical protein ACYSUV_11885 [Planctomycetota bacterium]
MGTAFRAIGVAMLLALAPAVGAEEKEDGSSWLADLPVEVHGFYEMRAGYRTQNDPYQKDMSIMENRLQVDLSSFLDWADFKFKGDAVGDLVTEEADFDTREAYIFTRPLDFMDLKTGRQILTWGTGDLVFINDLFPKDWQSFFIGRDVEYLKAPSDAVKASFFSGWANLDIAFTPQFDPDRYITGERISYWNSNLDRLAGRDAIIHTDKPNCWFEDFELAARLYKNINNYEYALYGYHGFWKSPGGLNETKTQAIFPDLNVYGTSVRGTAGKGIGNLEFGYYESADDQSGSDGLINNSELRFLVGYTQEVGKDFTAGVQYYLEHMLDYDRQSARHDAAFDKAADEPEPSVLGFYVLFAVRHGRLYTAQHSLQGERQSGPRGRGKHFLRGSAGHILRSVREQYEYLHRCAVQFLSGGLCL